MSSKITLVNLKEPLEDKNSNKNDKLWSPSDFEKISELLLQLNEKK